MSLLFDNPATEPGTGCARGSLSQHCRLPQTSPTQAIITVSYWMDFFNEYDIVVHRH